MSEGDLFYTIDILDREIERQTARIAELEAALEPFAKFCEAIDAMETRMGIPRSSDKKKIHDDLFVGDFRRARAALEGKG